MTSPEFIQSAATAIHQARELFDAGARANLLQTLTQAGHPYGLLFDNSQVSGLPVFCSEVSLLSSSGSDAKKREKGPSSIDFNTFGIYAWLFNALVVKSVTKWSTKDRSSNSSFEPPVISKSDLSYENSFLNALLSLRKNPDTRQQISAFLKTGSVIALKWEQSRQGGFFEKAAIAPILLKVITGEKSAERSRELRIGKNSVSLGTTAIKLATYKGEQPFVVRTPRGEPMVQINPDDQLGHLHVSHQAALMRGLSPLQKAEQITQDFIDLFRAVDQSIGSGFDAKQQAVLARAQTATLIGISHLVRMFRHRTGLPTWKLDVLPDLVQKFHQHDSQAVSKAFGGTRKVKPSDVEMMVITPGMRQVLVAAQMSS